MVRQPCCGVVSDTYSQTVTFIPAAEQRRPPLGAVGLVVAGLACQEIGASFAVLLFPAVGAVGVVTLRLVFSALVLLAIARPSLRGHSRADWLTLAAFGIALAGMNFLFYEALSRLHLGATVTIEVIGPLVLSVVSSRRAIAWLWALLAFVGVAILGRGGFDSLDPIGVAYAFGAAALWAAYILMSKRTGGRFDGLDGLAIAMAIGAVLTLPFGMITAGPSLYHPGILGIGLAVAVLSSAVPYAFELMALRRLPAATFSIMMSVSPAIATLAGFAILHQQITLLDGVAIAIVVAASAGAVRFAGRARPPLPAP
jgi:inner membrane transporter RhtA